MQPTPAPSSPLRLCQKHRLEIIVTPRLPFLLHRTLPIHIHTPFFLHHALIPCSRTPKPRHPPFHTQPAPPSPPRTWLIRSPYRRHRLQCCWLLALFLPPATDTDFIFPPLRFLLEHVAHRAYANLSSRNDFRSFEGKRGFAYACHVRKLNNSALVIWTQDDFNEGAVGFDEGADAGVVDGIRDVEERDGSRLDIRGRGGGRRGGCSGLGCGRGSVSVRGWK